MAKLPPGLDQKDGIILGELDFNSRATLASIAKKARMSKEAVFHRIRKLTAAGYIKKFYAIVDVARLGYSTFKLYFQLQNTTEKDEKEIISFLKAHPSIFWVASASGRYDLLVGIWVKDPSELSVFLEAFLNRFGNFIMSKEVTLTKKNTQWNRAWLTAEPPPRKISVVGGTAQKDLTNIQDKKILAVLASNARAGFADVAEQTEIPAHTVSYHVKQMEKNGVICSFRSTLNLSKFDMEFCKSFVYLTNYSSKRTSELIEYCRQLPNVLNVVTCIGSWDVEIEFEVESFGQFHSDMARMRSKFQDIFKSYESVLFSKEHKLTFVPGAEETMP